MTSSSTIANSGDFELEFREIITDPVFSGARFGLAIHDVETGQPIFEHLAHDIFPGASTTKITTAAYVLTLLGTEFRYRTRVLAAGELDKDGTLHGDLILVAAGDPNLSGRIADDVLEFTNLDHSNTETKAELVAGDPLHVVRELANAVAVAGVRRVTGTVIVNISLFDEGLRELGTFSTVSPIAVNDNQIDIRVRGGARQGDLLAYEYFPRCGYVRFIEAAQTGELNSPAALAVSRERRLEDGSWEVEITGSIPPGQTVMAQLMVEAPSRFARTLLAESLAAAGVVVEGGLRGSGISLSPPPIELKAIAEHVSPPLVEATKVMLKVSQNLHAEMFIPMLGALVEGANGKAARAAGYARCARLLEEWGMDPTGAFQGDACGAFGAFSPDFMCRLLVRLSKHPIGESLNYGLPILGRDGTLWDIEPDSPAAGAVSAKTGTLTFEDPTKRGILFACKGLAGYMDSASGRRLAFTLYLNNFLQTCEADHPGQTLGKIATSIFRNF